MRKWRQGAWEYIKSPLRTVQRSEMQSFPAGEGLWPRRKWCYMLVRQLQHHTAFLVSKLVLLMPSKRKSSEMKSKEKYHTHTYKLKENKELSPVYVTSKTLTNCCPLEATLLNYTSSSQSESSSVWRLTDRMSKCRLKNFPLLLNPIQRAILPWKRRTLTCPSGKSVKPHTKNSSQKNLCPTNCNFRTSQQEGYFHAAGC